MSESYFPPVEDYDSVDYSSALQRESRRRQHSLDVLGGEMIGDNSVRTGFITAAEYRDLGPDENNEVWFDVLPSFELYQSVHNLASPSAGFSEDSGEGPPGYTDTPPISRVQTSSGRSMGGSSISTAATTTGSSSSASSWSGAAAGAAAGFGEQDFGYNATGSPDSYVVDNTHRLPRLTSHPAISVEIYVTKNMPKPYEKVELESMLKEYTSGDVVHGYVIINNDSARDVPFHMFYVTLEGTLSNADPAEKKMYNRKFLNMIDISACFSYSCVTPSANLIYVPGERDHDNCQFGLDNRKVLKAKTKYKKFFTFKVPYTLLDTTCRHSQELHTLLPPSFGINRYDKKGKYAHITVNDALKYGHTGRRGSPILTRDLSVDRLSVNYSINATLIGLHPTKKDVLGQPMLAVMKEDDYALRFIPFGFGVSLFSSTKAINLLKSVVKSSFHNAERGLKLSCEGKEDEVQKLDNEIKMQQLSVGPYRTELSRDADITSFPLRNEKTVIPDFSKIESQFQYVPGSSKKPLFGKKQPGSIDSGLVTITTRVPKDGLPYVSPPLIRKTNEVSKLTEPRLENYDMMSKSLSQSEKKKLTNLEFDLSFAPSDFAKDSKPPEFSSISAKLLIVNVYSKSSIPIKLSSDLFISNCEKFTQLKNDFVKFDKQYQSLEKEFQEKHLDIRRYVDRSIVEDIHAMKNLKADTFLSDVFKSKLNAQNSKPWVRVDNKWQKHVQVDLEFQDMIRETLIPNFQSCLMSRIYCIQVDFTFKGSPGVSNVRVPIRLRWFD